MAEWLTDTIEAAEFMAQTVERARAAPKVVVREMHAYALGLADETGQLIRDIAEKGKASRAAKGEGQPKAGAALSQAAHIPPSSNTGGKGIDKSIKTRGKPV